MRRILFSASMLFVMASASAFASGVDPQQLVDRATLAAQDMLNDHDGTDAQKLLRRARAVMICPQVFRAGFIFGGEGGDCVLVARDGAGSWSSPAFFGIGSGSIGFQAGIQDAQVMFLIMSDKGLSAVMDSQFKLGADANATFVQWGGGVEGATTAALRADIVAFTRARGLYAGISLSGSIMGSKTDWNQAYYGRALASRQIVVQMEAANPAADPLRMVLTRYGTPGAVAQPVQPPGYAEPTPVIPPGPRGAVQSQALPAPGRR